MLVLFSDSHIGFWRHRKHEFKVFLDWLSDNKPDVLVGLGDLFDLWVRDMAAIVLERNAARLINTLYELEEAGTEILLVAGNHDWHLRKQNIDPELAPKWGVPREKARLKVDGVEFYLEHGHLCEPGFDPVSCEALSYTNDYQGRAARNLWDSLPKLPSIRAGLAWAIENMSEPGITARPRAKSIENCLRRRAGKDAWIVYGHTHLPFFDSQRRIMNTGAFEAAIASFIVVEAGTAKLNYISKQSIRTVDEVTIT